MHSGILYRRSAFTRDPEGGNPAGVWIGETLPSVDVMQQIAAEVGYSETAFVAPAKGPDRFHTPPSIRIASLVRLFSPAGEAAPSTQAQCRFCRLVSTTP